jgi:HEAT repeat protein
MQRAWMTVSMVCAAACLIGSAAAGEGEEEVRIKGKTLSALVKQLNSSNRGLQVRAARALSEAPKELYPKIVPRMIPLLEAERENLRFVAAQTLGNCGPLAREAVPKLVPLLKGTQFERNRAAAAKALGQILKDAEPSEEVEKVAQALTAKISSDWDQYSDVRREAARALGMIGPAAKSCIPKLKRVMTDHVGDFKSQFMEHLLARRAAAWTCGRMGPLAKEHIDLLISMMHSERDRNPEVVEAIGLIGPVHENVIPNIMDRIESLGRPGDYGGWKARAFAALGRFGAKSAAAVPLMRRMLQKTTGDTSMTVKIAMVKTLAQIGPAAKEAAPEILSHIKMGGSRQDEQHKALKEAAEKAYKAVTGQDPPASKK